MEQFNFKDGAVSIKSKKNYINAKTIYKNDKWYALVKNIKYIIIDSEANLHLATVLYAKPNNDKKTDWDEWYNKSGALLTHSSIIKYWSKYKPNMIIKGNIIDNKFKVI